MTKANLVGAPETGAEQGRGDPGSTRPTRTCPECLAAVVSVQPNKLFCCTAHQKDYANRWIARGSVLAPLQAAARQTRGGSRGQKAVGARARREAEQLLQRWKEEDAAKKRMSAIDYVAIRYRLGLTV